MAEVIAASLQLDAEQANQTVKNFKEQLKAAQENVAKLTQEFGATSKEVEDANKVVARLQDNLNKLDATTAGNSIKDLKEQLNSAEADVINLTEKFGAASSEVLEANKVVADLKEGIKKIDATPAANSVKGFKQQLKEAQLDVITLTEKFGATSKEAINAAKRAAELKDRMADAKTLVDAFNPDKKFNAFAGALGAVTGGFAAVQGAMGLLGIESEDLQKQLLKVQSAMAVSQGLNSFLDSIQGVKTFGKVLVQTLGKSGLIGIAIAGVGLLGAKLLGLFDKKIDLAARTLSDSLKELAKGSVEATREVLETKNAFDQARQGIISQEDALKTYNEGIGQTVGLAKDLNGAEKLLADNADNYIKVQGLKAQANYILGKSAELAGQAIIDQANIDKERAEGADSFAGGLGKLALEIAEKKIAENKKEADRIQGLVTGINDQIKAASVSFKPPPKTETKTGGTKTTKVDDRKKELLQSIQDEIDTQAELDKLEQDKIKRIAEVEGKAQENLTKQLEENVNLRIEIENSAERAAIENSLMSATEKQKALAELDLKFAKEREQARFEAEQKQIKLDYEAAVMEVGFTEKLEDDKTLAILAAGERRDLAIADAKAISDGKIAAAELKRKEERDALQIELDDFSKSELQRQLDDLENWYKEKLKIVAAGSEQEAQLTKEYESRQTEVIKESKLKQLQIYGQALGQIADLVGKSTVAGKAMAVAEATINTYAAAAGVLRNAGKGPQGGIPGFAIAQMIATIAAGLVTVRNIVKTKVPNQGSSGSVPSIGADVQAPITPRPQVQTTALDQNSLNQIGNATTVRAFVIEQDVANNSERVRRLNRAARLG